MDKAVFDRVGAGPYQYPLKEKPADGGPDGKPKTPPVPTIINMNKNGTATTITPDIHLKNDTKEPNNTDA